MSAGQEMTLTEKAIAAMQAAIRSVVEDHVRRKNPLVVWRDGAVVWEDPRPLPTAGQSEHEGQTVAKE